MDERRRETLDIPVTPANIRYAGRYRAEVLNAIERGTFEYQKFFPNSRQAKRLAPPKVIRHAVNDLVDTYIDTARKTKSLSPSSIDCYAKWARARLKPKFEGRFLDELTTPDLRTWIADLSTQLAPKSVRNCVGLLSGILNRAVDDQLIASSPLAPIKLRTLLPRRSKADDKVDPFNSDEITAILGACESTEERALWQFAFASGLRTGEQIAVKWDHIDSRTNTIHVQDNVVTAEVGTIEKPPKTAEGTRRVPILPGAKQALRAMEPLSKMRDRGGYIFLTPEGNRWRDDHQIRNRWRIILRKAGVRYRNPYQTRHTFASTLLMAGEAEIIVANLLGHATVEMVRRHYGRYIKQPGGIVLRGDYSKFGADSGQLAPLKPALSKKTS